MKQILLITILLLSSCCDYDDRDCTTKELQIKQKAREEAKIPQLITVKDGINLYYLPSEGIYFTTPCGDVSWDTEDCVGGKPALCTMKHHKINGTGCNDQKHN